MRYQTTQYDFQEFGQLLREKRIKSKLGQRDISKLLGLSGPQYVSNIERGVVLPSTRIWEILCRVYKMNKSLLDEVRPSSSMDNAERRHGRTKGPRRITRLSSYK